MTGTEDASRVVCTNRAPARFLGVSYQSLTAEPLMKRALAIDGQPGAVAEGDEPDAGGGAADETGTGDFWKVARDRPPEYRYDSGQLCGSAATDGIHREAGPFATARDWYEVRLGTADFHGEGQLERELRTLISQHPFWRGAVWGRRPSPRKHLKRGTAPAMIYRGPETLVLYRMRPTMNVDCLRLRTGRIRYSLFEGSRWWLRGTR